MLVVACTVRGQWTVHSKWPTTTLLHTLHHLDLHALALGKVEPACSLSSQSGEGLAGYTTLVGEGE